MTNQTKAFSVVLLHYRQEHYWPTAIDSIAMQDYPNIEIVFADDGTPGFDENRVIDYVRGINRGNLALRFMTHDENKGTLVTFNDADRLCTGDYVLHFASDDALASPEVLSRLAEGIDREPEDVCGVFGRLVYCDESLVPTSQDGSAFPEDYSARFGRMSAKEQFAMAATRACGIFPMGACAFRASAYKNTIPVVEGTYLLEDWPYEAGATYKGYRFCYLPEDVLLYRAGGASRGASMSMSTSQKQAFVDHAHCYETAIFPKDVEQALSDDELAKALRDYAAARKSGNLWFAYGDSEVICVDYLAKQMFERILGLAKRLSERYPGYTREEAVDLGFDMILALAPDNYEQALDFVVGTFGKAESDTGIIREVREHGKCRKRAQELEEENQAHQAIAQSLQQEIHAMRSSYTWKIGTILVFLPSKVKRALRPRRSAEANQAT